MSVAVVEQALAPALERLGQEVPDSTPLHAKCPSCAAEFGFPANLHAGPCPFCSRPVVLNPAGRRLVPPQAILPFLIGEPEAKRLVGEWPPKDATCSSCGDTGMPIRTIMTMTTRTERGAGKR